MSYLTDLSQTPRSALFAANKTGVAGTVLASDFDGFYRPLSTSDGAGAAVAILYGAAALSLAPSTVLITAENATVSAAGLVWPSGATGPQISAWTAALRSKGIVAS